MTKPLKEIASFQGHTSGNSCLNTWNNTLRSTTLYSTLEKNNGIQTANKSIFQASITANTQS
jgi:hypothetical protein